MVVDSSTFVKGFPLLRKIGLIHLMVIRAVQDLSALACIVSEEDFDVDRFDSGSHPKKFHVLSVVGGEVGCMACLLPDE